MAFHRNVHHVSGEYGFPLHFHNEEEDANGIMVCYVDGIGGNVERMSGKYFTRADLRVLKERKQLMDPYCFFFVPTTSFPREDGKVFGLGNYIGERLQNWLEGKGGLWEVDHRNSIKVAGAMLGSLLRNIAAALTWFHSNTEALGLECNNLYVDGTNFKLSDFIPYNRNNRSEVRRRILRDLEQFKEIVNLVAGVNHVGDTSLVLFNNLLPTGYQPRDMRDLVLRSYILCHSPLLWTIRERFNFSSAYDFMYKHYNPSFRDEIGLDSGDHDIGRWWNKIPTHSSTPLTAIYDNSMGRRNYFIVFLRICYNHYLAQGPSSVLALDADIMRMFPHAFSKVYGEMFENINDLMDRDNSLVEYVRILGKEGIDFRQVFDEAVVKIS